MRLGGKVAVVTGAASGIGHAIATLFTEEGATVYATDIAPGEFGTGIIFSRHDVTIDEQWRDIVAQVDREQDRLSILVNNASAISLTPTTATTMKRPSPSLGSGASPCVARHTAR